jgi:acyl carrier protein
VTPEQARAMLDATLREIVPDADLTTLPPGADLRDTFELDSLDFVELVDRLSTRAGFRIEEDDADGLRSAEAAINFLVANTS